MKTKKITIEFINGMPVVPEKNLKLMEEVDKQPITFSKDCPKLTPKQLSEFVRWEDFVRDRDNAKIKEATPETPKKRHCR